MIVARGGGAAMTTRGSTRVVDDARIDRGGVMVVAGGGLDRLALVQDACFGGGGGARARTLLIGVLPGIALPAAGARVEVATLIGVAGVLGARVTVVTF